MDSWTARTSLDWPITSECVIIPRIPPAVITVNSAPSRRFSIVNTGPWTMAVMSGDFSSVFPYLPWCLSYYLHATFKSLGKSSHNIDQSPNKGETGRIRKPLVDYFYSIHDMMIWIISVGEERSIWIIHLQQTIWSLNHGNLAEYSNVKESVWYSLKFKAIKVISRVKACIKYQWLRSLIVILFVKVSHPVQFC